MTSDIHEPDAERLRHLRIEYVPIDELIENPANTRKHSPGQIRRMASAIRRNGFLSVVVVRNKMILAGHGRRAAGRAAGLTELPVIRADHLSEMEAKAFALSDNKLSKLGEDDPEKIAAVFGELIGDPSFDLEWTGFDGAEIDSLVFGQVEEQDDDGAGLSALDTAAVTQLGQTWLMGVHALACGNSLNRDVWAELMGSQRAAMVFADVPFNERVANVAGMGTRLHREFAMASGEMTSTEYLAFLEKALGLATTHSINGSVHFLCIDHRHVDELLAAGRATYARRLNICVWHKPDHAGMGGLYRSAHELVVVYQHGEEPHRNNVKLGKFGRNRTNVWAYPGKNGFVRSVEDGDIVAQHPTPKPPLLVMDAILDVTKRGDIVVDPFLGVGASLIAAERSDRICRSIEIDPLYVDLSVRRWQKLTGGNARLADGTLFDDAAARASEVRS